MVIKHLTGTLAALLISAGSALALSVDDFARDKVLFDVGAAFGRDAARIEITGQATSGARIEVRTINEATGEVSAWNEIATASDTGSWSGNLTMAARSDWYRIEVRSEAKTATTTNRFGTGDVVAILGQSEQDRLFSQFFSGLDQPGPTIARAEQVQFTHSGGRRDFADADATNAMRAMADHWIRNAPENRKVHFVDLAESGTARTQMQDDSNTRRQWSTTADAVGLLRGEGTEIGLVLESWFAADRGAQTAWAESFMPLYTGTSLSGDAFTRGDLAPNGVPVDHFLWDLAGVDDGLFKVGQTALGIFGPHRFDADGARSGPTTNVDGSINFGLRAIERSRDGVEAFMQTSQIKQLLVDRVLPQALDYANGFIDPDSGEWVDTAHPSYVTVDGQQRKARHVANAALHALGHTTYEVPVIDSVRWTMSYVEFGSDSGPLTTARLARGLSALDDTYSHWTDAFGFDINGVAAHRAEITPDGKIRVYAPGDAFSLGDQVSFGLGGAGGFMAGGADWSALAYLNMPIVDVGLSGLEGVALLPGSSFEFDPKKVAMSPVPLPASVVLLFAGLSSLLVIRRRR